MVGGGSVGFGIRDEAIEQVRRLNWDISVRLFKVNAKGIVVDELGSMQRSIGTIQGNRIEDLLFQVSPEPAYYRVDISFQHSGSDHVLGKFSNYVRVMRPWFDARLLMLGSVARQGELLSARLANFGTESIASLSHDWRFAVEYFDGQNWVIAPSNPPPEKHKAIGSRLGPGRMDQCVHLRVSADEAPGLYRLVMVVDRSLKSGENRTIQLATEFEVSGRSLK
ncbi:MAG TPA: hypothetical protein VEW07_12925 [Solirubrobacterales bacterium]|nr:hypothetical protein [Solirubrobacterales bacterium]